MVKNEIEVGLGRLGNLNSRRLGFLLSLCIDNGEDKVRGEGILEGRFIMVCNIGQERKEIGSFSLSFEFMTIYVFTLPSICLTFYEITFGFRYLTD